MSNLPNMDGREPELADLSHIPVGGDIELDLHDLRIAQHEAAWQLARGLFIVKNRQYGDAISANGVIGSAIELAGISGRLHEIMVHGAITCIEELRDREPDTILTREKRNAILFDKFIDAINYGIIGLIMMRENNFTGK